MRALCLRWRSKVFQEALVVLLGFGNIVSSASTTAAGTECTSAAGSGGSSTFLSASVPTCAQSCVQQFINTEYSAVAGSCCSANDLTCLCRSNTTSGLTLGEAALACIVGSCPSDVVSSEGSVGYAICDDVPGALPETHGVITATRVSVVTETASARDSNTGQSTVPSSVIATSTNNQGSTLLPSTQTSTVISTRTTATAATETAKVTPTPTITTMPVTTMTTVATTTSPTTTPSAVSSSSTLSSPAVIGVSIASGISAVFLVAVAIFFCGRRLRRKRLFEEEGATQSFEIGGEMSEPPDFTASAPVEPRPLPPTQPSHFASNAAGVATALGAVFHQFPSQPINRHEQGPLVILPQSDTGHNNDKHHAAASPEIDDNGSPQSQTSQRSISRLLPERVVVQGMFPEPLRVIRQPNGINTAVETVRPPPDRPLRPNSDATVFDEDEERPTSNINTLFGPPLNKLSRASQQGGTTRVVGLPAGPRPANAMRPPQRIPNLYDADDYSYKWEKAPAPIPSVTRLPVPTASSARFSSRSSRPWNGNENDDAKGPQRNFSRLGRGIRHLNTPPYSHQNMQYTRNTMSRTASKAAPPFDSSYETIPVEDDWSTADRSKLSLPSQLQPPRQSRSRLMPRGETGRLAVPGGAPTRYPAIPRSAAIVPAPVRGMRKSHVAEVYYDNSQPHQPVQGSQPSLQPPVPNTSSNTRQSLFEIHELGSGQRSRSASPSPSTSSLLMKRRGETVADKMETQFRSRIQPKPGVSSRNMASSATVVGPSTSGEAKVGDTAVSQSSPATPKKHNITPTRRGDDLYLRVDQF